MIHRPKPLKIEVIQEQLPIKEETDSNSLILQTIKKKSFLGSFISPDKPKQNISFDREVLTQPDFLKENPELYKIVKEEKPKLNVGLKRALINNSRISEFFSGQQRK